MTEWVELAERIASNQIAPIFFAGILLWMIWRAGKWVSVTIIEPAAKSHVSLLDSVREVNEKNSDIQARQTSTMDQIASGQRTQTELLSQMAEAQRTQTELIRNLNEKRNHDGVRS